MSLKRRCRCGQEDVSLTLSPAEGEGVVSGPTPFTVRPLHPLAAQAASRSVTHLSDRPAVVADTLCTTQETH